MELSNVKPNLDSLQPNQSSSAQAYHNYTDVNALSDLKKKARDDQESALRPVAEQFEAIFVQQILKEARKVSFDEGWLDGGQGDFYKDWSDKQLSLNLSSKGTLGFADNIVEQLGKSIHPSMQIKHADETVADVSPQQTVTGRVGSTEHALALRNITNNNLK
ncbi:rod-binding protein [Thiomicrorhabdus arctica]|uniref:rod-binding protein n=1 Tax=Thiomicrorhabdus arctica TaxID=131540 RepID=UPI00037C1356|nr:rod-binding protein [Thiomicrorhabdus arctica]